MSEIFVNKWFQRPSIIIFLKILSKEQKEKFDKLAYTSFILHLSDTIFEKVGKLDTTKELRKKLENLYFFKSTPNK